MILIPLTVTESLHKKATELNCDKQEGDIICIVCICMHPNSLSTQALSMKAPREAG